MTPLDLAKRECLRECGQLDYRYCAEWLNAYSMECLRRLTAGTAGCTAPLTSPRREASLLKTGSSSFGVGSPLSHLDERVMQEWREQASCYDSGGGE